MKNDIIYLFTYLFTKFLDYTLAYIVLFQIPLKRKKKKLDFNWWNIICYLFYGNTIDRNGSCKCSKHCYTDSNTNLFT